ncbi:MAG: 4Fe-4S dicluster domain-containing protein [Candidatus Bathyarchaeota archaeon]|nr:MAG: 4Fe-4S dicluster domain-containing protein [Candidatus Bathyarchaeota archaeon]
MEEHFGGRWIEVDFVTLMLQLTTKELTEKVCQTCDLCTQGCPSTKLIQGFTPHMIISQVRDGKVKEILRSDMLWRCTSCLSCREICPKEISPYEVVDSLRNLSARIGYHFPRFYKDLNKKILRTGLIQEPKTVPTRTGQEIDRRDLPLPPVYTPLDMKKFAAALNELARKRVIL